MIPKQNVKCQRGSGMITIRGNVLHAAQKEEQQVRKGMQSARAAQTQSTSRRVNTAAQSASGHINAAEQSTTKSVKGDLLTISAEALGLLQEQDAEQKENATSVQDAINELFQKDSYQEQIENSKKSGDAFADDAKMLEIARRIAAGDKVPAKDERKLMEYNSKLYQAAKSAAMLNANKKHKKYKSLFDDDEDGQSMEEKLRELERGEDGSSEGMMETSTESGDSAESSSESE